MVTRSRARGGREINVDPEIEFLPEAEIPAQTDEGVSGATRHLRDIASQYIPETAITQEVRTSTSRLPPIIPRNLTTPHICYIENFVSTLLNLSSNRMIAIY